MKLEQIKKLLKQRKIGLMLIINSTLKDPNFMYLADIEPEYGFLVIPASSKPIIYCSTLEYGQLKKKSSIKNFKVYGKKTLEDICRLIKKLRIKKIGLNYSALTASEVKRLGKMLRKSCKGLRLTDISMIMKNARAIKTKVEINNYKKATRITEKIWEKTLLGIKKKKLRKERDVSEFLEKELKKHGKPSFPTIVASGRNSAVPHYYPENRTIKGFCVIDFGLNYKGYCTDITRTIYIGKPSEKEKEMYDLVYRTKKHSEKEIKDGARASKAAKAAAKHLGKYAKYFTHGLGHGIGVEIHEIPNLKELSTDIFKEGMIFTIEPGIYFNGRYGIRIEDDYLLEKKGLVQLTKAPEKLVCV